MTLPQILTAVVAVYGAFLSSATFLMMIRSKRWRASISFSIGSLDSPDLAIALHIANSGERTIVVKDLMLYVTHRRRLWLPESVSRSVHYILRHHRLFFRTGSFSGGWILEGSSPLPAEVFPGHSIIIRVSETEIVDFLRRDPPFDNCWIFFGVDDAVGNEHDSPFLSVDLNDKDYPVWPSDYG